DREQRDRDQREREQREREQRDRDRDRDRDRPPPTTSRSIAAERAPPSAPIPWRTLGVGAVAAAVVIVAFVAISAWRSSGPATLIVRTEPRGASVTLDGKPTGQETPALLRDVEAGTAHKVRVEIA